MLRSLAFVFALALNGHSTQPPQPQTQVTTESPGICKPQAKCEPCPAKAEEGYWRKAFKPDVLPVWIGGVSALLASIGGLVALYFIKKQVNLGLIAANAAKVAADAARDSADAYVTSERPFVMIEARGQQGFEFWAVNHGKSPAQIIFSNPVPFVDTPLLSELPKTLHYGYGFDIPNSEQINVQWIAPGGSHSLGAFQPEIMGSIGIEAAKELAVSLRVMIVYSAFKYRGIDGKRIYTSTYCYRKYPSGLQMWGSYGWNQYT